MISNNNKPRNTRAGEPLPAFVYTTFPVVFLPSSQGVLGT
jgi:hypothetical protein